MKWGFLSRLFPSVRRRRILDVASLSACGLVRADNQDHFLVNRGRAFFCVADGMGGGEGGAEASDIVCRCIGKAVACRTPFPERVHRAAEAIRTANREIRAYAQKAGYRQMATTVTVFAVDERAKDPSAVIGYVGDSRVYRIRDGAVAQLTHDHTMAGELSRRGSMKGLSEGLGLRVGKLSHVLTRAVGIESEVQPDWKKVDLREGDWILICSDGVYDMVSDEGIREAFAAGGRAEDVAARLERKTLDGGAVDNYTMVVVKVGGMR